MVVSGRGLNLAARKKYCRRQPRSSKQDQSKSISLEYVLTQVVFSYNVLYRNDCDESGLKSRIGIEEVSSMNLASKTHP